MKSSKIWAIVALVAISAIAIIYAASAIKPPRPELASSPLTVPEYTSTISLPASLTVERLRAEIEANVPPSMSQTLHPNVPGNFDRESFSYTVHRGPIEISAENGAIVLTTNLKGGGQLRARHCPLGRRLPCHGISESGVIEARAVVTLANIRVTPEWRLTADFNPVVHVSKAEVRLIGDLIPVSLRTKAREAINDALPGLRSTFDDLLAEMNLKQQAETAWQQMDHIVQIAQQPATWVVIEPASIGVAPVRADAGLISSAINLTANVRTVIGDRPDYPKPALPHLADGADSHPGFSLKLPVVASLSNVAAELNKCCSPIELPLGDDVVKLRNITLHEGGGKLIVAVDFSSGLLGAHGRLYLEGAPQISDDKRTLTIANLDYDVRTRQALLEGAAELAKPAVLATIKQRLSIDLAPYYEKARAAAREAAANLRLGAGVQANIQIDNVAIDGILTGGGQIAVIPTATGSAQISVGGS